jgi:hypothetical protein
MPFRHQFDALYRGLGGQLIHTVIPAKAGIFFCLAKLRRFRVYGASLRHRPE